MEQSSHHWKKSIRYAAKSDIGLRRANNQDSFAVIVAGNTTQWMEHGHLFVVADGMGAHAAGEVASKCATETITQSYLRRSKTEPPHQAIVEAVYDAHRFIRERSAQEEAFRDMGTTADALLLLPYGAMIAHVGDSRVYRLRNQMIEQLTFDHSLVWEVCMATNLAFDKAPSYIPKNQITRSLGPTESLKVDLEGLYPIAIGDTFLLCSDGLSGQVTDREIGQILSVFSPEQAVETLVNLANLRGGPDNITVIIVQTIPPTTEEPPIAAKEPISLFGWGALALAAIGLLVTGIAFALGAFWGAIASLVFSVVMFVTFFVLSAKSFFAHSLYEEGMPPFGKGPYTRTHCPAGSEFVEKLAEILHELRLATQTDRWSVQSPDADNTEQEAKAAMTNKDYAVAIRCLCMAINYLMRELKRVSVKKKR